MKFNVQLDCSCKKRIMDVHDAVMRIPGVTHLKFEQAVVKPGHLVSVVFLKDGWWAAVMIHARDVGALLGNRPLEEECTIRSGRLRHDLSFEAVCRNGTITVERFIPGEWEKLLLGWKKSDKRKVRRSPKGLGHRQSAEQNSITVR